MQFSHALHAVLTACVIALLVYLIGLVSQIRMFLYSEGSVLLTAFIVYELALISSSRRSED